MVTLTVHTPKAVVDPPRNDLNLVAFTETIEGKLTGNVNFANIGTVLTDLTAARTAFAKAISNKATLKDMATTCKAARRTVLDKLGAAVSYINGVASQAAVEQAGAIIESSGFRCKKVVVRAKPPIEAKYGGISGAVLLIALGAGRSAVYYFQVSTDQKTWTACPNVMKCKTTVSALTVGTTYYFRVQTQTHKGLADWSPITSFVAR